MKGCNLRKEKRTSKRVKNILACAHGFLKSHSVIGADTTTPSDVMLHVHGGNAEDDRILKWRMLMDFAFYALLEVAKH